MDCHDYGDSGAFTFAERGGADEGEEVVDVDYVGFFSADCLAHGSDSGGGVKAGEEGSDFAGEGVAKTGGGHAQLGDGMTGLGKHLGHFVDDGFLAGVGAVIVMDDQYTHSVSRY